LRIGFGYDIHPLVAGRPLILGGVRIPHEKGLAGHSDADALCHAVADAVLGAGALGDIGEHFPDTDPQWKGADSLVLLGRTGEMIRKAGFSVTQVDATVVLQSPKLGPYKTGMAQHIAQTLRIPDSAVSVKAKTNEGFGEIGRGEACAVFAVALLEEKREP
jgi:2-C-methyl-D-erythritol 2,4-cyclodiphosphate synthase